MGKIMYSKTIYVISNISLGKTNLMYAARNGKLEVVKLLLEHNADVQAKSNTGEYLTSFIILHIYRPRILLVSSNIYLIIK